MATLCSVLVQQRNSKNPMEETQLLLLLLLPLAVLGRDSALLSNLLWARGMCLQELSPKCPRGSLFKSPVAMFGPLHRLGLTSCIFHDRRWVGRPLSGSAMSPFLCQPASELRCRVRAKNLLRVWCKAFFYPRICTSFRVALTSC